MTELEIWEQTTELLGSFSVTCGKRWSELLRHDPTQLPALLSRYKFAAKMVSTNKSVLELGCDEGMGATILAEQALSYTGVDADPKAIASAQTNNVGEKFTFICSDVSSVKVGAFEAVVSFDVPDQEVYFETIYENVAEDGVVVVSTPSSRFLKTLFYNIFPFPNSIYIACNKI